MSEANLQLTVIAAVVIFAWLMLRLVAWIKTKRINTELWCTVFEGLTQGAIRLDHLKNPQAVIEKKVKRDGRDKDNPGPENEDCPCGKAAEKTPYRNLGSVKLTNY